MSQKASSRYGVQHGGSNYIPVISLLADFTEDECPPRSYTLPPDLTRVENAPRPSSGRPDLFGLACGSQRPSSFHGGGQDRSSLSGISLADFTIDEQIPEKQPGHRSDLFGFASDSQRRQPCASCSQCSGSHRGSDKPAARSAGQDDDDEVTFLRTCKKKGLSRRAPLDHLQAAFRGWLPKQTPAASTSRNTTRSCSVLVPTRGSTGSSKKSPRDAFLRSRGPRPGGMRTTISKLGRSRGSVPCRRPVFLRTAR